MPRNGKVMLAILSIVLLTGVAVGCRTPQGDTPAQKRASVRSMRNTALADLYKDKPQARGLVDRSVGYAVFSSIGTNFGVVSTARGFGILKDKRSGKDTYMEMLSLGGGFGAGVKDVRLFFIFLDPGALDRFLEQGLDFGGQVEGIAQQEDEEGIDFSATQTLESTQAKVVVLQLTEQGLSGQATLQGTRYTKDEELN